MLRLLRNLVLLFALVLGIAFGFFNFQAVTVDLLWTEARVPLVVVLVVDFILGVGLALLLLLARTLKLRADLSRERRRLQEAQAEIRNLRSMPIHDA